MVRRIAYLADTLNGLFPDYVKLFIYLFYYLKLFIYSIMCNSLFFQLCGVEYKELMDKFRIENLLIGIESI